MRAICGALAQRGITTNCISGDVEDGWGGAYDVSGGEDVLSNVEVKSVDGYQVRCVVFVV